MIQRHAEMEMGGGDKKVVSQSERLALLQDFIRYHRMCYRIT